MIITSEMGTTILDRKAAGQGAKEWAAAEGKQLGSEVVGALGDRLGDLIRGGGRGNNPQDFIDEGPMYIGGGSPMMNPVVIGGLALGGLLVVALVASR